MQQVFHDAGGRRRRQLALGTATLAGLGAAAATTGGMMAGWPAVAHAAWRAADALALACVCALLAALLAMALRSWAVDLLVLARRRRGRVPHGGASHAPDVCVIVPAYNEEATLCATVRSLLASDYAGSLEILVVDDGSTDATLAHAQAAFGNHPRVRLLTQANGGKCSALNLGLRHARAGIVVCIDADTLLAPDALRLLCRHFHDGAVGAVAGYPKVGNQRNLLTRMQALEYLAQDAMEREACERLNAITCVTGAIGAYRRDLLLRLGGYAHDTLAEDNDMTLRILRDGWQVAYEEHAIAWTEAPETLRDFLKQRFRWMYGTVQAAIKHSPAAFRRRGGSFGWVAMPHLLLQTALAVLLVPAMDLGLLVLGLHAAAPQAFADRLPLAAAAMATMAAHQAAIAWALGGTLAMSWLMTTLALRLERREPLRLALWYLPTLLAYRVLLGLVAYRCIAAAVLGRSQGWGSLQRTGTVPALGSLPGSNPLSCP